MGTVDPTGQDLEVEALEAEVRRLRASAAQFRRALSRLGDALASTHDRTVMVNALLLTTAELLGAPTAVFYGMVAGAFGAVELYVPADEAEEAAAVFAELRFTGSDLPPAS